MFKSIDKKGTGSVPLEKATRIIGEIYYAGSHLTAVKWQTEKAPMEELLRQADLIHIGPNGDDQVPYESLINFIRHGILYGNPFDCHDRPLVQEANAPAFKKQMQSWTTTDINSQKEDMSEETIQAR